MSANAENIWRVPAYLPYLQPPLTDAAIADAEKIIGYVLPKELIALLRKQNGGYIRLSLPEMVHDSIAGIGPHYPSLTDFDWDEVQEYVSYPASEQIVMKIPQPFSNHNGGSIAFGHDGYLYIALGDGGGRNDPLGHGQNLSTLMGSMLRIDVNQQQDGKNYAIPADNPFLKRDGALPEIYAYGFRNIWRMAVDRKNGTIWAADVGQDFWEEVNIVKAGGNYGWSIREASFPFNNKTVPVVDPLIAPVWEYDHQLGKSITGGFVYRGARLPELQGMYVYADFISGRIWALTYDESQGKVTRNMGIATTGFPVLAFGEDEAGELYYMLETVNGKGIYRFDRTE